MSATSTRSGFEHYENYYENYALNSLEVAPGDDHRIDVGVRANRGGSAAPVVYIDELSLTWRQARQAAQWLLAAADLAEGLPPGMSLADFEQVPCVVVPRPPTPTTDEIRSAPGPDGSDGS